MSERGFVSVDRGVFDHPMFAPEPFTEREAWLWMIAEAAWKPMTVRAGRAVLQIDRGQIACSLRFLATRWKWPETSVRRFLSRLAAGGDDALVLIDAAQSVTRITICNYDKYQNSRRTERRRSGAEAAHSCAHSTAQKPARSSDCHETENDETWRARGAVNGAVVSVKPAQIIREQVTNNKDAGLSARERLDRLEQACREAAGYETDPSPGLLSLAPILGLMEAGMDLELDILPAIKAAAARMRRPARSWEYFREAIVDWHERRNRPVVVGISGADPPAKFDQWAKQRELVKKLEQKYNQKEQVA
jgi:hypothetical protein